MKGPKKRIKVKIRVGYRTWIHSRWLGQNRARKRYRRRTIHSRGWMRRLPKRCADSQRALRIWMRRSPRFLPASLRRFSGNLGTFRLSNCLKAALSAYLAALASDSGHVLGNCLEWGIRERLGYFGYVDLRCGNLACGSGHSPGGELIRVAGSLSLADGHTAILPHPATSRHSPRVPVEIETGPLPLRAFA